MGVPLHGGSLEFPLNRSKYHQNHQVHTLPAMDVENRRCRGQELLGDFLATPLSCKWKIALNERKLLAGGFKDFLFSPLFGEMIQF